MQAADRFLIFRLNMTWMRARFWHTNERTSRGMVAKYGIADEYDARLTLPPSVHIPKDALHMGEALRDGNLYSSLVDSLRHLSLCTRLGITHSVGLLSRYLKCPRVAHCGAGVHMLRFLKDINNVVLFTALIQA